MQKKFSIAGIATCIMVLGACEKDPIIADSIECEVSYDSHPMNEVYQDAVNKGFGYGLPGVSAVIYTPEHGFWAGSAGYASVENNIPMTPCHIHYAASIPKSYTAVAILQLIEDGILSPDSKISGYLDDRTRDYIPNCEDITIHHLLNHTSGIPDQVGIDFLADFLNNPEYYYSQEELMSYLDGMESLWKPGTKHYYSDANYNILALILDRLTGDHLRTFRDNCFVPLGLENTYYSYTINLLQ
jgi:D-alanyl-D-alanine carboxypeptidase